MVTVAMAAGQQCSARPLKHGTLVLFNIWLSMSTACFYHIILSHHSRLLLTPRCSLSRHSCCYVLRLSHNNNKARRPRQEQSALAVRPHTLTLVQSQHRTAQVHMVPPAAQFTNEKKIPKTFRSEPWLHLREPTSVSKVWLTGQLCHLDGFYVAYNFLTGHFL